MIGLVSYGAYLPHARLLRAELAAVLGSGRRTGSRAVAGYDEDTTSMGVEAGRLALAGSPLRSRIRSLFFATSAPAYLDKTNATAIHAALQLDRAALALDLGTSVHSGVGALTTAAQAATSGQPSLAILSDIRTGRPGSADETDGGDGAAAFVFGSSDTGAPVIAELIASSHSSVEVLERWRLPGMPSSRVWEERFGEEVYLPVSGETFTDALKQADAAADGVDHLIVAGLHTRTTSRLPAVLGTRPEATVASRSEHIGNAGVAQAGILLADVLDTAESGVLVAVVVISDGVSVLLFRTTAALASGRSARPVATQTDGGDDTLSYATFLSWRGHLEKEPPRRPDPEPSYGPPAWRRTGWKFGFVAARCEDCGARHLPPSEVCNTCFSTRSMAPVPMSDVGARIVTFTVDRLAATPSPPLLLVVLDFDGGGRFRCELTDAAPDDATIGGRVEMTFRRTATAAGVHNYFWKARPLLQETS